MTGSDARADVVGVVPAAGRAARIGPLPCSKEIYPVGFRSLPGAEGRRPKAVCHYLLERMRRAGVTKAYIVLRAGKWDIPAYLGDGGEIGIRLAYLVAGATSGTPHTVSRAQPFVADATVAFGFPDMIFRSQDVFVRLLSRQRQRPATVLLGTFPARPGLAVDVLDMRADSRVRRIVVQPPDRSLRRTWGVAVWTPRFSAFLGACARADAGFGPRTGESAAEVSMGSVIQRAVEAGFDVDAIPVCDSPYLDIGTPDGLAAARNLAGPEPAPEHIDDDERPA